MTYFLIPEFIIFYLILPLSVFLLLGVHENVHWKDASAVGVKRDSSSVDRGFI